MSYRPYQQIARRASRQIRVGNVPVGGDAPISVQTMTNTPTEDAAATIAQIRRAEVAGVDIVRVSCPTPESTAALAEIGEARRARAFFLRMEELAADAAEAPARARETA